jgi:transposase
MVKKDQSRKKYPADLTDAPWAIVAPLLPPAKAGPRGGHPRQGDRRAVLNTLLYLKRRGGPWDRLPPDLLPTSPVYDDLAPWRHDETWAKMVKALRAQPRVAAGREPTLSAAGIESQSGQTTERGGPERGHDGGQHIQGRQRHLWVDTWGLGLALLLTRAGLDEGMAAPLLLSHVTPQDCPRLMTLLADQKEHTHGLAA